MSGKKFFLPKPINPYPPPPLSKVKWSAPKHLVCIGTLFDWLISFAPPAQPTMKKQEFSSLCADDMNLLGDMIGYFKVPARVLIGWLALQTYFPTLGRSAPATSIS